MKTLTKRDAVLLEAKRLYDLGFAILWIYPKDKRPIGKDWTSGPRKNWKQLVSEYEKGMNVGVRTGSASKIGENYLAVIDVDIKKPSGKPKAYEYVRALLGKHRCPQVLSGSRNGSMHFYAVTSAPFKMITHKKQIDFEICIYSEGRQMVLPPSIHPSGKPYVWNSVLIDENSLPLMDFSQVTQEKKAKGERISSSPQKLTKKVELEILNDEEFAGISSPPLSGVSLTIRKLILKGEKEGETITDRSAFLPYATYGLHSAGMSLKDVLLVLTDRKTYLGQCAYDHAKTQDRRRAARWLYEYTVKEVWADRDAKAVFQGVPVERSEWEEVEDADHQNKVIQSGISWEKELKRAPSKQEGVLGNVMDTLNNVDLILSHALPQPIFKRDEFTQREVYGVDAPWGRKKGEDLKDIDVVLIKSWLSQSQYYFEPKNQTIENAMALLAHRNSYHPVRDWLKSLKWDGVKRVDTWLKKYCRAQAPEPYLSEVSRKFLVAMVARIFKPGCPWDFTLVLEGEQGTRKSTTALTLASEKWFCDHLPDLRDKDAMLNLQGAWVVELAELKNVKHSDASTVKAFLTRKTDRVRAPYGKRWVDVPRQSVFIGTVNENEYLKDPTGNRRFLPVSVGQCLVEDLKRDREQLFAEAVHIYKNEKEKLFITDEALEQSIMMQDERRVEDDLIEMEEALTDFIEEQKNLSFDDRIFDPKRFRLKELFSGPWKKWDMKGYARQNGAQVLRGLGFSRSKIMGQRVWKSDV